MANRIYGLHLLVDGKSSNPDESFTKENLESMITQLAANLDMDIIYGPMFLDVPVDPSKLTGDVFRDEGGTSGFCMISTSHISIHVWPLRKTFMCDIFSCKDFDKFNAMATLHKFLKPSTVAVKPVYRTPEGMIVGDFSAGSPEANTPTS